MQCKEQVRLNNVSSFYSRVQFISGNIYVFNSTYILKNLPMSSEQVNKNMELSDIGSTSLIL